MRDLRGDSYRRVKDMADRLDAFVQARGYEAVQTPVLEETELFARKSGGELTGQLYSFVDPAGHNVSLRPEFTSSVIRHFVSENDGIETPVRWQYSGPVFRYEGDGAYRQFHQMGAELIGLGGIEADAEILALAWDALAKLGVQGAKIRVGNLGVLQQLMAPYDLSEAARLFVFGSIQDLKLGKTDSETLARRAREMGLMRDAQELAGVTDIGNLSGEAVIELMQGVLAGPMSGNTGRRSSREIIDRLISKWHSLDRPENLKSALDLVASLASIEGSPTDALARAWEATTNLGLDLGPLDNLDGLCDALSSRGIDSSSVTIDLGLARGISYYTGMIFELTLDGVYLGGGGRYDGLVRALGGGDVPALGFAFALDQLADAVEGNRQPSKES
jgi:histidyl-tRNA synthetase